jgi:signal-transduction protein with cAMP-binding, CBS, and nucleotidyltransferase domain
VFSFYGIRIKPGVVVYSIDENAGIFFIILSGKLKSIDRNGEVKYLVQNNCFGKSSLVVDGKRQEKIITEEPTLLVCLNGDHYRDIIESYNFDNNIELKHLSKVHLFSRFIII